MTLDRLQWFEYCICIVYIVLYRLCGYDICYCWAVSQEDVDVAANNEAQIEADPSQQASKMVPEFVIKQLIQSSSIVSGGLSRFTVDSISYRMLRLSSLFQMNIGALPGGWGWTSQHKRGWNGPANTVPSMEAQGFEQTDSFYFYTWFVGFLDQTLVRSFTGECMQVHRILKLVRFFDVCAFALTFQNYLALWPDTSKGIIDVMIMMGIWVSKSSVACQDYSIWQRKYSRREKLYWGMSPFARV